MVCPRPRPWWVGGRGRRGGSSAFIFSTSWRTSGLRLGAVSAQRIGWSWAVADHFSYKTASLDDLLKEENPRSRAIYGLTIKASASDDQITLSLVEAKHRRFAGLSVEGREPAAQEASCVTRKGRRNRLLLPDSPPIDQTISGDPEHSVEERLVVSGAKGGINCAIDGNGAAVDVF